jgi:CO/xanthine dehydrogenase FAD-binding subunit
MDFNLISPLTKAGLLDAIRRETHFRFGAGYTDLLMELKKKPKEGLTVINLSKIKDPLFTGLKKSANHFRLGSMVTAAAIIREEDLRLQFPVLNEAAFSLASTQIRQVATIGGNICTASPSGDIACALMALGSSCEILGTKAKVRKVPLVQFFTGVRQTALKDRELLYGIYIPANNKKALTIYSRFLKIGTRRSMECSVVSLACHIQSDREGTILQAGIAIGAAAPAIRFAGSASAFLTGKNRSRISEKEKEEFANLVLSYASPISDIRASAWYRKKVLFNISKSIFE